MNRRDIDVVVLPGDVVTVDPGRIGGFLPHAEGRRDLGLRRVLAAISHAEALVSDIEDDSAYLVWGRGTIEDEDTRGIITATNPRPPFLSGIIVCRAIVLTTAVDTTAHSI